MYQFSFLGFRFHGAFASPKYSTKNVGVFQILWQILQLMLSFLLITV
jgi:hypothetical protein